MVLMQRPGRWNAAGIDRAHAAGEDHRCTIIPRGVNGFHEHDGAPARGSERMIRRKANFDGIIDFAELLKGAVVPANSAEQILPAYSCFDGIHPNDSGYDAMGKYIDLKLFRNQ
jgi:hypothetical protein